MSFNLITILGPTATGKTKLAAKLAHHFNGEIISADSRQVYKEMDIGTGKDLSDYDVEGVQITVHLVDVVEPKDEFNLYGFIELFNEAYDKIIKKKKLPFLVGGSGLYLNAILQKYQLKRADFNSPQTEILSSLSFNELKKILIRLNPKLHNTTDLVNKERLIKAIMIESSDEKLAIDPLINSLVIGIKLDRSIVKDRITDRLKKRLDEGMIDEVKNLIASGISLERLDSFGLEYKFIGMYLKGDLNYDEMFKKLNTAIHNFAKRQMTWFRKMEREGININWLDGPDFNTARNLIETSS